METAKPPIAILLAVYEPRMDWLRELLSSLEAQSYPNLRLYIRDDCSPTVKLADIEKCVSECIRSFPYTLRQNETNLGSNRTFEALTAEAEGEYFAYCDQDDIWLPEKLTALQAAIEREQAELACSDMFIIDGEGKQTAGSITQIRRHHIFHSGEGLAPGLLISNFVTGCTMLVRARTAKAAIPFCPYMYHDHYLALYAAMQGKLISLPESLMSYRIHGRNQTSKMAGVKDRKSYLDVRVEGLVKRLSWLCERFPDSGELTEEARSALEWAEARRDNFLGKRGQKGKIWRGRRFSLLTSLFEILLGKAPERLFMICVELNRRNIV